MKVYLWRNPGALILLGVLAGADWLYRLLLRERLRKAINR